MTEVLSPAGLEELLRTLGAQRYHHRHPFHLRLHAGACSRREVRAWAANRYIYQAAIPRKDAIIVSRIEDPDFRRAWRRRIEDHDGRDGEPGGLAHWLQLTDALALPRAFVASGRAVLPGTRFAVGAYLDLVRHGTLIEAIASSLTELFAPTLIEQRVSSMLAYYPFIDRTALAYFAARPERAGRDSGEALAYVLAHAKTPETQGAAVSALAAKCDILWAMLDALHHAYVEPGHMPPGIEACEE